MAQKTKTEIERTEIAVIEVTEGYLREKMYEFRGRKVMLDSDLAEIYGYETKNFNRQVKNNSRKFQGDDFMFEGITDKEICRRHSHRLIPGKRLNCRSPRAFRIFAL